jgi:hypothetical protein
MTGWFPTRRGCKAMRAGASSLRFLAPDLVATTLLTYPPRFFYLLALPFLVYNQHLVSYYFLERAIRRLMIHLALLLVGTRQTPSGFVRKKPCVQTLQARQCWQAWTLLLSLSSLFLFFRHGILPE